MSGRRRTDYRVTLVVLLLGGTSYSLQQTMVVPAIPALERDFHASGVWTTWVVTGFLLCACVATPILGRLGDQFGKRRMLLISMSIFFAGSVASAAAPTLPVLIAARVVQGVGGTVFPLSFAIIRDEFPPERVASAVGAISAVYAVGGGSGLVLSGVIIDALSWRWIFVLGGTIIGLTLALAYRYIPESRRTYPSKIDVPGAVTLSLGLFLLLFAITEGATLGWTSALSTALFTAAVALLGIWVAVELRTPEPMVDVRMLALRPVLAANVTALLAGFAMFGSFVIIPAFVETPVGLPARLASLVHYGFGAKGAVVGLYLLPGALTGLVSGQMAGRLGKRYGENLSLALGMVVGAIGTAGIAIWHAQRWQFVVGVTLVLFALSYTFAGTAILVVSSVEAGVIGVAAALNHVTRTVGGIVGGQVGAALLASRTIGGTSIPAESAFTLSFAFCSGAALLGALAAAMAKPGRRRVVARPADLLE